MAHDYLKKEPTKNEKMLYELAMRMEMMDRSHYSMSMHLLALGKALNISPEKMAEMLTAKTEDLQEYGKQINEAIDGIRKKDEAEAAVKEPVEASELPEIKE